MCQGLHRDTVHKPDLRLVLWVRQVAVAACIDGFVWEQWVAAGCMPIADPDAVTTSTCLHACYPRILLMLDQRVRHGPLGVSGVYIHGLCQR